MKKLALLLMLMCILSLQAFSQKQEASTQSGNTVTGTTNMTHSDGAKCDMDKNKECCNKGGNCCMDKHMGMCQQQMCQQQMCCHSGCHWFMFIFAIFGLILFLLLIIIFVLVIIRLWHGSCCCCHSKECKSETEEKK